MLTCTLSPLQRKDFPSSSFYVVVVVKTEDEACGGPLRFYPLRPDELIDAGNRTKVLDVVVSPAINCECCTGAGGATGARCSRLLVSLHSSGVCDGDALLSGHLPLLLPAHFAGGLCGETTVRHFRGGQESGCRPVGQERLISHLFVPLSQFLPCQPSLVDRAFMPVRRSLRTHF